ncbi:TetR/AcrR family transcriptional regulator [Roseivirga echinicomitans]
MNVSDKILEKATELYTQFGIRSVTMDDIAKELGISKKTIYQYYKDKSELVSTITKYHFDIERQRFSGLSELSNNGVHELVLLSTSLRDSIKETKINLLHELQKFYPKAWKMYEKFKVDVMKDSIIKVIERGKSEGYFRPSIDAELVAIMRIEQVQTFLLGNLVPRSKYSTEEIQMQLFDHFMHGLFTIEGHQLFNQYTTNSKNNEEQN